MAMQNLGGKCVFSSEWDEMAKKTYLLNYGEVPFGDITKESTKSYIPDGFDVLCAGFPCQAFSNAGHKKGFADTRGTLFFEIERILKVLSNEIGKFHNEIKISNLQLIELDFVFAKAMLSIGAVKGIEFGKGFEFASLYGSEANDEFVYLDGIKTTSNNNGGINGGISNGMPIIMKTCLKPTPSISKEQNTVDLLKNKNTTIKVKGRHDPCIVHRARVVVDSMVAIGILDLYVQRFGYEWM